VKDWLARYATTEGLFSVFGVLWFFLSSVFPVIPNAMPIPAIIPGFEAITPGLLVCISLVPILLKTFNPATAPFINQPKPLTTTTTATVTTTAPAPPKEKPDA